MSNSFIPFTEVPPSAFVHYFQNLHISSSNRNYFQQCVERMPDIYKENEIIRALIFVNLNSYNLHQVTYIK